MKTQQTKYPRSSKAWSSSTLSMARFNLNCGQGESRTGNNEPASRQVWCGSVPCMFRKHHASAKEQRPATQGHQWPLGKYAALAKGAWGDRTARMLILLRSRGKCLDAVSMYSLLATHGVARRKPMSANRQGREHLQKKPPTTRERRAHQTVRWLTPYRSASEPDNFSRYISYL